FRRPVVNSASLSPRPRAFRVGSRNRRDVLQPDHPSVHADGRWSNLLNACVLADCRGHPPMRHLLRSLTKARQGGLATLLQVPHGGQGTNLRNAAMGSRMSEAEMDG